MGRKGLNLYDLGRLEEAISYFDKVLDVDSNNSALYYKSLAREQLGKYADAIDVRNHIIDSNNIDMIFGNALDLSHLGKYEQALTYYDKVLAIDPYRFNALINKAFTLDNLSRYNESLAYFDKVLTINPDEDIALNGKGEALLKLGKCDEAIPYFDKIIAINSSDSGFLVVASKNKQFALDALKNAVNDVQ